MTSIGKTLKSLIDQLSRSNESGNDETLEARAMSFFKFNKAKSLEIHRQELNTVLWSFSQHAFVLGGLFVSVSPALLASKFLGTNVDAIAAYRWSFAFAVISILCGLGNYSHELVSRGRSIQHMVSSDVSERPSRKLRRRLIREYSRISARQRDGKPNISETWFWLQIVTLVIAFVLLFAMVELQLA